MNKNTNKKIISNFIKVTEQTTIGNSVFIKELIPATQADLELCNNNYNKYDVAFINDLPYEWNGIKFEAFSRITS